jgi:hypothetical protein
MEKYTYKDGTEVKAGDICFYSEYDGENWDFHYADTITVIQDVEGELYAVGKIFTQDNAESFVILENDTPVHIKYGCSMFAKDNILMCFTKIGKVGKDDHMITVEYAMENYRINNDN